MQDNIKEIINAYTSNDNLAINDDFRLKIITNLKEILNNFALFELNGFTRIEDYYNYDISFNKNIEHFKSTTYDTKDLGAFAIYSLIEKIKKHNTPVIFVTAKESVLDRVKGLRLGAEDYIIKPFETIELLARVEVVLRRYNKNKQTIKFKNIEVDTEQRIVNLNNKEVYLTVKEYELLVLLLQNKNRALSRDQILERVWRFEYGGETRTVDIHIQRIREKLDLKNNIKTVFKVGYRLEE